ncbi:hypothetical protein [Thermodesulfovibrio sp. 3462-1]|uniref:DUF1634 domain-containing protein n=1 Tax=Thermodesulfovibrio obliviosus TaxID=3118332 RepID=A0AAU8H6C0_9BACT
MTVDKNVKEEQIVYAKWLDWGMKIGLILLILTFIIYITGILSPQIPISELPKYWKMKAYEYLLSAGLHPGWAWLKLIIKSDFLNFVPIAILGGITILCYIRILPIFLKKKDIVYFIFSIIECFILILAASGILHIGGH